MVNLLKFTLTHDLQVLVNWFKANKLSLNVSKTVLIQFWLKDSNFTVTVEGITLKAESSMRFLGVHVDNSPVLPV